MPEGKSDDLMEAAIRAVDAAREDMLLAKASDNTYLLRKVAISVVHGALLAERQRDRWLPIDTAPKDGTEIILYCPQGDGTPGSTFRLTSGSWFIPPVFGSISDPEVDEDEPPAWLSWDGGFSEETMMPTRWMPLPSPPSSTEEI